MGDVLVERAAAGDRPAGEELLADFRSGDAARRGALLDALAVRAGLGAPSALELLLRLIDEHRLDRVAIRRILIDDDQADDAHQDTLIAVARSTQAFRGDAAFTTWLHAVARNVAIDHLRRRRESVPLTSDLQPMGAARRLSSMIATRADLRAAVEALPEHYRTVVVLRDVEQWSYRDIADELGLELNTVRSRLSRGRALLAAAIGDSDSVGGDDGDVRTSEREHG